MNFWAKLVGHWVLPEKKLNTSTNKTFFTIDPFLVEDREASSSVPYEACGTICRACFIFNSVNLSQFQLFIDVLTSLSLVIEFDPNDLGVFTSSKLGDTYHEIADVFKSVNPNLDETPS